MSTGSKIRRAREAAGLTLADLADRTKIRASLLEAMERDDFSSSGGDIYVRMQLRAIAEALGLGPEELSPEVGRASRQMTQEIPVVPVEPSRRGMSLAHLGGIDRLLQRRRGANWTAAMVVALVAAVGVLVAIIVMRNSATDAAVPTLTPAMLSSAAGSMSPLPQDSFGPTDDTTGQSGGVTVVVDAVNERSWVSVTGSDGTSIFDGLIAEGSQQTFRDPSVVRVVIGNAGAVTLSVNGTDLGEPGALGDVASLEFGPGTPSTTLR